MGESKSILERKTISVEKKNTVITLVALLVWLGISILGQAIFMDEHERMDAGAIMVAGGGPILLISALHLLLYGIRSWGLIIRSILGIIFIGAGVGELTDVDKGIIWSSVGAGVLVIFGAALLWKVLHQK